MRIREVLLVVFIINELYMLSVYLDNLLTCFVFVMLLFLSLEVASNLASLASIVSNTITDGLNSRELNRSDFYK